MKKHLPLICSLLLFTTMPLLAQTILTGSIGEYDITQPGTYIIKDTVIGNLNVKLQTQGAVEIVGFNDSAYYEGIPRPGEKRAVGHIGGNIGAGSSITIHDVTLAHNVHHIIDFGGDGRKHIYNVEFIGQERLINGKEVFGVAPGNMGGNGLLENCVCRAGDDAHQVSLPGSEYKNNHVIMYNNGSAFQFGWNKRFKGRPHHADSIKITGNISPNINKRKNDGDNPGRCVIGGVFNNAGGDIRLTNLDIDIPQYNNLIKMRVGNVKIDDIYIQGILRQPVYNAGGPGNLKAVALSAKSGGKIENMIVDLGDEVANPANHFIKGNVNVKFKKSDGTYVEYINGKLQGVNSINELSNSSEIKVFPIPFNNYLNIQSEKNIQKIELFALTGSEVPIDHTNNISSYQMQFTYDLPAGSYLLKVTYEHNFEIIKIIKQ